MSDFPNDFAGTEHYREKPKKFGVENPFVGFPQYQQDITILCDHIEGQDKEIEGLREENDWTRRWMGEFGYTSAFEGWRKFKTPAPDDGEEKP